MLNFTPGVSGGICKFTLYSILFIRRFKVSSSLIPIRDFAFLINADGFNLTRVSAVDPIVVSPSITAKEAAVSLSSRRFGIISPFSLITTYVVPKSIPNL